MVKTLKDNKGISMIEVLVASAIFAVGLLNMGQVLVMGGAAIFNARVQTEATILAQEMMEEVQSKAFDEAIVGDDNPFRTRLPYQFTDYKNPGDTLNGFPLDADEVAGDKSTFDDMDDYSNFVEDPVPFEPDFKRTVKVVYADADSLEGPASLVRTEYKKIIVRVESKRFEYKATFSSVAYYRGI